MQVVKNTINSGTTYVESHRRKTIEKIWSINSYFRSFLEPLKIMWCSFHTDFFLNLVSRIAVSASLGWPNKNIYRTNKKFKIHNSATFLLVYKRNKYFRAINDFLFFRSPFLNIEKKPVLRGCFSFEMCIDVSQSFSTLRHVNP